MANFIIKQPESEDELKKYYRLRWKVLRQPWGKEEGSERDDIEDTCFHVIAKIDNEIIGVGRIQFITSEEAQIRYMAVDSSHRGRGIGAAILQALEQHARTNNRKIISLDARENAVGFYKKNNYELISRTHLLFDVIQHYKMTKAL